MGSLSDLGGVFSRVSADMRSFRDREVGGTQLQQWWSVAERNTPQLMFALRRDPELVELAKALMESVPAVLKDRETALPDHLVGHAERLLKGLQDVGSRQARIDASRALEVLGQVQGSSTGQAIERVGRLRPSRTPERPTRPPRPERPSRPDRAQRPERV